MAVFGDPEHWTFRGGPLACEWGDEWLTTVQGQVQWDRSFYLYGLPQGMPPREQYRDLIRLCRRLAHEYSWTELIWVRMRKGQAPRVIRIPIDANMERSAVSP